MIEQSNYLNLYKNNILWLIAANKIVSKKRWRNKYCHKILDKNH